MATLPMDRTGWSSKTGLNVGPPFVVLTSPPVPVPTKSSEGLPGTRAISLTRPPMLAGPTGRQERARSCSVVTGPASPAAGAAAGPLSRAAVLFFGDAAGGGGPGANRIKQPMDRRIRRTGQPGRTRRPGNGGIEDPPGSQEIGSGEG